MSDNDEEKLADGLSVKRGPDGTFESVQLDSERASQMGKRRWSRKEAEADDDLDALLEEAYGPDRKPPKLAELLAGQIASGGARSIQAAVAFMRLTRADDRAETQAKPKPGEVCPTCGCVVGPALSPEAAADALRILDDLERRRSEKANTPNTE